MRTLLNTIVFLLGFAGFAAAAGPLEFRVESEVMIGSDKKPAVETLTIFVDQVVYDFHLTAPEETTIFDIRRGRITLIDQARKVRTSVSTDEVLSFSAAYKTRKSDSPVFAFCTNPVFEESADDTSLQLKGGAMSYRVLTSKPEATGAERFYREFADWSARLNGMRPGNLPPFARMELNKAIAARGMLPVEIERTVFARNETMRSRHLFNWTLSTEDRRRIDKAGTMMAEFPSIDFPEYVGAKEALDRTARK